MNVEDARLHAGAQASPSFPSDQTAKKRFVRLRASRDVVLRRPADVAKLGPIPPPRIIGRTLRFLIGAWLLYFLHQLITQGNDIVFRDSPPNHWAIWVSTVIGLALTPYLVNIGFSQNWKNRPRVAVVALAIALVLVDFVFYGSWWALPLGVFALAWFVYWSAHLGCFVRTVCTDGDSRV